MTIVEFLLARIAEDEAFVAHDVECRCPENDPPRPDCGARIQAECAAKRGLIEAADSLGFDWATSSWEDHILGVLAAVYADHPDYDPVWRV